MAESGPRSLVILGAGGHAQVVAEVAALSGWICAGHLTPETGQDASGALGPWLGDDAAIPALINQGMRLALGLGFVNVAGAVRRAALISSLPASTLVTLCHPAAVVSGTAILEAGAVVSAGAILAPGARLGRGAILNTGAILDHDSQVGTNSHIATGACILGGVEIGRDVLIGAGAVLRQSLRIGDGAVIGAGAVVVADVPCGAMLVGNPARPLEDTVHALDEHDMDSL